MRTKMRIAASILTAMLLLLTFVGQTYAHSSVASQRLIPLSLPSPLYNNVKLDDDTTTPKIIPSWWTGTNGYACDAANYYANTSPHTSSFQLGTTTNYRGVKACGPRPNSFTPAREAPVNFYSGAPTEDEWMCTELVKRYLYQAFGAPDRSADGKGVVSEYATNNDLFQSYSNNSTANQMPVAGNVLSFDAYGTNTAGHTAVVTGVSVDANGNGTVNIMEQNSSSNGTNLLYVGNPVINGVAKDPGNAAWHIDTEPGVGAVLSWLDTNTLVTSYNPDPSWNKFYGVSSYSANNVWAVGSYNYAQSVLIEKWDGAHWTQQVAHSGANINPGTVYNVLYAVKALSPTNIWAVGYYNDANGLHTLIEHSTDGSTWSQDTSYQGVGYIYAIDGNPSTGDAWAVGQVNGNNPLVLHLSNGSWSKVNTSADTVNQALLYGVSEDSSSNVWVVGDYNNSGEQTFTMYYNHSGNSWTNITSPTPGSNGAQLKGVVNLGSSGAWAVGYEEGNIGFLIHGTWNGSTFTWGSTPSTLSLGSSSNLYGIAALDSNNIWAVGTYYDTTTSPLVWHTSNGGSTWAQVTTVTPAPYYSAIAYGIAINKANGNTWAIGEDSTGTFADFFN
jgi:CHAP domain